MYEVYFPETINKVFKNLNPNLIHSAYESTHEYSTQIGTGYKQNYSLATTATHKDYPNVDYAFTLNHLNHQKLLGRVTLKDTKENQPLLESLLTKVYSLINDEDNLPTDEALIQSVNQIIQDHQNSLSQSESESTD